jgi:hypothetical protein
MSRRHRVHPVVWLVCLAVLSVCIVAVALRLLAPPDAASPAPEPAARTPAAGRQADERPSAPEAVASTPVAARQTDQRPSAARRPPSEALPSQSRPAPASRSAPARVEPPGAPGPDDETERLLWLQSLQDWGKQNPLAASLWAIDNLSPEECWSFLGLTGGIAFQLGAQDMQKGLSLLQNLKKWDGQKVDAGWQDGDTMYSALMAKFAAGAVTSAPAKAIELAREYGSLYELAGHWAELDPQKATQWADSLTDAAELDAVVKAITWALVNKGKRDDMVDWVNSLEANPAAYDLAVTTMLVQLPKDEVGPVLDALLKAPPDDAAMILSWIRGASRLGEQWSNNAEVQSALRAAIALVATEMYKSENGEIRKEGFRDAVDYLATGGGGVIPEVAVGTWSPTWVQWAEESPSEAIEWLAEHATGDNQTEVFQAIRESATQEGVAGGYVGIYRVSIGLDNQGDFRLTLADRYSSSGQQFTYANGRWTPPLPQDVPGEVQEFIMTPIRKRLNLLSALARFHSP